MKHPDDKRQSRPERFGSAGKAASGNRRAGSVAGATGTADSGRRFLGIQRSNASDSVRHPHDTPRQAVVAANRSAFALVCELLREGQSVSVCVEGQSMLPFFRSGSVVRLRPLAEGDLVAGRVVLGQTGSGQFVIHRILHLAGSRVVLLGDGNTIGTETVLRERIYGIVDCGPLHLVLARVWTWLRPVRKYPLWILRRFCR